MTNIVFSHIWQDMMITVRLKESLFLYSTLFEGAKGTLRYENSCFWGDKWWVFSMW